MQGYWRVGTVVLAAMLAALPVAADEERGLDYNLVRLEADAAAEVPNDLMRVTLAVEHNGRDAAALPPLVNADMRWALDLAKQRPTVKAQSGEYTTQPEYAAGRIVGWRAIQVLESKSEGLRRASPRSPPICSRNCRCAPWNSRRPARRACASRTSSPRRRWAFAAKAKLITGTMGAARYEVVEVTLAARRSTSRSVAPRWR